MDVNFFVKHSCNVRFDRSRQPVYRFKQYFITNDYDFFKLTITVKTNKT